MSLDAPASNVGSVHQLLSRALLPLGCFRGEACFDGLLLSFRVDHRFDLWLIGVAAGSMVGRSKFGNVPVGLSRFHGHWNLELCRLKGLTGLSSI